MTSPGVSGGPAERNGHPIETEINARWVGWACRTCQVWATWVAGQPDALDKMQADAERHAALPPLPPLAELGTSHA